MRYIDMHTPGNVFSSFGGKNLAADKAKLVSAPESQNRPRSRPTAAGRSSVAGVFRVSRQHVSGFADMSTSADTSPNKLRVVPARRSRRMGNNQEKAKKRGSGAISASKKRG